MRQADTPPVKSIRIRRDECVIPRVGIGFVRTMPVNTSFDAAHLAVRKLQTDDEVLETRRAGPALACRVTAPAFLGSTISPALPSPAPRSPASSRARGHPPGDPGCAEDGDEEEHRHDVPRPATTADHPSRRRLDPPRTGQQLVRRWWLGVVRVRARSPVSAVRARRRRRWRRRGTGAPA